MRKQSRRDTAKAYQILSIYLEIEAKLKTDVALY
jgi:hypothetical protein